MDGQPPKSLQDILRQRQRDEFVGRENQLSLFRQNLEYKPDDPNRRFVFNIFGQGGIGKTYLLRRFCQVAVEHGAITAWTDESEKDVPAIMARLVEQIDPKHQAFHGFHERFMVYRQRRHELEADPEAPQGLAAILGRTLVRAAYIGGDLVPGLRKGLACHLTNSNRTAFMKKPMKNALPSVFG